jgi:YidC/Oxa1 family membrane protein insertase
LWIKDITTFDIGLMFVYVASQFLASWQMARKGAGQQKIISYMMPVIVGIFMFVYKWPAGLFIYWFTSNLWTIAQQFVLEKVVPAPVPVTSASGKGSAATRAPGGTARSASGKDAGKGLGKDAGKAPVKSSGKTPGKSSGKTGAPAKQKTTPAQPAAKTPAKPSGKSGGKTSGQQTGKQGKAAGSKGQRTDGGTGGPAGSGGA